jgi:hypothetical protein
MSYHCGIGEGMRRIGIGPCEPHIRCDGCGATRSVTGRGACGAAAWFLAGRAAPGWAKRTGEDGKRIDLCPRCKP